MPVKTNKKMKGDRLNNMQKTDKFILKCIKKVYCFKYLNKFLFSKNGFGFNELLGIAAAIIVAAFVVIPGLKQFADSVIDKLGIWWLNISTKIFPVG